MTVPAIVSNTTAAISNAANSASSTSGSSSSTGTDGTLNYNEFLQLLVAQLQNQDPTNPTDPTTFVSQLASFSTVEQQVNTNSILNSLLTQTAISQAPSLVGQTVTSSDGTISGQVASVTIGSSGPQANLSNGQTLALGSGIQVS
jgi:flagellar basal-body rod modification protein FlgD